MLAHGIAGGNMSPRNAYLAAAKCNPRRASSGGESVVMLWRDIAAGRGMWRMASAPILNRAKWPTSSVERVKNVVETRENGAYMPSLNDMSPRIKRSCFGDCPSARARSTIENNIGGRVVSIIIINKPARCRETTSSKRRPRA